mmetsp:Transcript_58023/g.109305  ORF Transcript_58023/g.109305 Transcript_58023/m.109305 type:complete len:214 (+) Transcript_58023:879-1520(+)
MHQAVKSFESASASIAAAQQQLSVAGVPSAVAAGAVKAAVAAVEAAVEEQVASATAASTETTTTTTTSPQDGPSSSAESAAPVSSSSPPPPRGGRVSATDAFAARGRSKSPKQALQQDKPSSKAPAPRYGDTVAAGGVGNGLTTNMSAGVAALNTELMKATLRMERQQKILNLQAGILGGTATLSPEERDAKIQELVRLTTAEADRSESAEDI